MNHGSIIFLNGTSSSGKTSVAHALQDLFETPLLYVSVDDFLQTLPTRYVDYLSGKIQPSDEELERLRTHLPRLLAGTHASIAALASEGNNLVVDYVFEQPSDLLRCVDRLADFAVFFVGVHCSLEELERRERQRDRRQGLAKLQFGLVHAHRIYDLEVDTTSTSAKDCARKIKRVFDRTPRPTAFRQIQSALPAQSTPAKDST